VSGLEVEEAELGVPVAATVPVVEVVVSQWVRGTVGLDEAEGGGLDEVEGLACW
jgi:hypothetical protein